MNNQRRTYCAPDGIISEGWRAVRKGGRVKFAGLWWQSDKLIPYVGQDIWCHGQDYWQTMCDFNPAEFQDRSEYGKQIRIERH